MANQPLARGRLAYISGTFRSNEIDPQTRQPKEKNRYATLGSVTAWPSENGSPIPQISIELDALPVGVNGSTKLFVFWDEPNNQQAGYSQAPQQQQPQSFGSWGNQPQGYPQQPQQNRPR